MAQGETPNPIPAPISAPISATAETFTPPAGIGPENVSPVTQKEGNKILAKRMLDSTGQSLDQMGFSRVDNKENMAMFEGPHGYKVGIEGPYGDRGDRWRVAVFSARDERIAYPQANEGFRMEEIVPWVRGYLASRQTEQPQAPVAFGQLPTVPSAPPIDTGPMPEEHPPPEGPFATQ